MLCEGSRASREPTCACCKRNLATRLTARASFCRGLWHAAFVLSRFVTSDDGRSAWARLRGKECDSPLALLGETVDFKIVRGEMAKLEPRWATGTFLGRTDESDEVIVGTVVGVEFARSSQRRTRDKQ